MADPAPEPVELAAGGSADWAELTPGQRVTFIEWARTRGYQPTGTWSYFSSEGPLMVPIDDPARAALAAGTPLAGKRGLFDFNLSLDFWLGLAVLLLLAAVLITLAGKGSRKLAPI